MPEEFCSCGVLIRGTSEKHLAANMKKHLEGNVHKKYMEAKKNGN